MTPKKQNYEKSQIKLGEHIKCNNLAHFEVLEPYEQNFIKIKSI